MEKNKKIIIMLGLKIVKEETIRKYENEISTLKERVEELTAAADLLEKENQLLYSENASLKAAKDEKPAQPQQEESQKKSVKGRPRQQKCTCGEKKPHTTRKKREKKDE